MAIKITPTDARYAMLRRSRNLRWDNKAEAAAEIEMCETAEQAADALQRIVSAGLRPTIRSGGHCYEDFVVNNPGGAILDLSLLTSVAQAGDGERYRISPGQQLGEVYLDLYKRHGVTIPAGSCYSVGAGGHITGAGFGVLSRLHGLTVDWLSAVEILTVGSKGHVALRRVDKDHEPDLFRACRGGGGGNFGVVTCFLFDRLPVAPFEVTNAHLSFDWKTMTEDNFTAIVMAFGNYWDKRGRDPETWGLFAGLGLTHASSGRFGLSLQFCNPDGRCDDLKPMQEFLDRFQEFGPLEAASSASGDKRFPSRNPGARRQRDRAKRTRRIQIFVHETELYPGGSEVRVQAPDTHGPRRQPTWIGDGGRLLRRGRECKGAGGGHLGLPALVDHEAPVSTVLGPPGRRCGPFAVDARVLYGPLLTAGGAAVCRHSLSQRILRRLLHQLSGWRHAVVRLLAAALLG